MSKKYPNGKPLKIKPGYYVSGNNQLTKIVHDVIFCSGTTKGNFYIRTNDTPVTRHWNFLLWNCIQCNLPGTNYYSIGTEPTWIPPLPK